MLDGFCFFSFHLLQMMGEFVIICCLWESRKDFVSIFKVASLWVDLMFWLIMIFLVTLSVFGWQVFKLEGKPWRSCIWLYRLQHEERNERNTEAWEPKFRDKNFAVNMGSVGNLQYAVTGLEVQGAFRNCLISCTVFKAASLLYRQFFTAVST